METKINVNGATVIVVGTPNRKLLEQAVLNLYKAIEKERAENARKLEKHED